MRDAHPIAIIGGGIVGLLSALMLAQRYPKREILLIERTPSLGGLLKSFNYGENGFFDCGAHILQETGIPELNELVFNTLPQEDWEESDGVVELCGTYHNGTMHYKSGFLNLGNLTPEQYKQCLGDFFYHLNSLDPAKPQHPENAYEFSMYKYGPYITEKVIAPILQKTFGKDLRELHRLAMVLFPLQKVSMFDEQVIEDVWQSNLIRERVCFTNQRQLPEGLSKKLFYPKHLGMQQLIDAFEKRLQALGVKLLTLTALKKLNHNGQRVESIVIQPQNGAEETITIDHLVWSVGIPPLAAMLNLLEAGPPNFDKPLKTVIVNLLIDTPLELSDIFYFFCFEPGFHTYRVVNYPNYCTYSYRNNGYPVTIEMLVEDSQCANKEQLKDLALAELNRFNILAPGTNIFFSAVEVLDQGFPMPTMKNIQAIRAQREKIHALQLQNLTLIGILSEDDLFFQRDTMINTYHKISAICLSGETPQIAPALTAGT